MPEFPLNAEAKSGTLHTLEVIWQLRVEELLESLPRVRIPERKYRQGPTAPYIPGVVGEPWVVESPEVKIIDAVGAGDKRLWNAAEEGLRRGHLRAWKIGAQAAGGKGELDQDAREAVNTRLRFQFQRLRNFRDLLDYAPQSVSYVTWRLGLYGHAMAGTAAMAFAAACSDEELFDWLLDEGAEHCTDCPYNAAGGPYTKATLPGYPGDGGTDCLVNCRCQLQRRSDGRTSPKPPGSEIRLMANTDTDKVALDHVNELNRWLDAQARASAGILASAPHSEGDALVSDSTAALDMNLGAEFADALESVSEGWQIVSDAVAGGLMRVRQRFTRADSKNKNKRVYPRKVLQEAVDEARPRARAGAMLSEYVHPEVVTVKGEPKYVDNHDRKSARVDDIEDVGADGWVWGTRTILDTPAGRMLRDRFTAGNPPGVSVRWKMRAKRAVIDSETVDVATRLVWVTPDDVENPAVDGAGEFQLLSDSTLSALESEGDAAGGNSPSRHATASAPGGKSMNEALKRALDQVYILMTRRASKEEIDRARAVVDEVVARAQVEGADMAEAAQAVLKCDETIAAYHSGRPGATVVMGNETGSPGTVGFAPDTRAGALPLPQTPQVAAQTSQLVSGDDVEFLRTLRTERQAQADEAERTKAVKTACDAARTKLDKLPVEHQDYILDVVARLAPTADSVPGLVDQQLTLLERIVTKERLAAAGMPGVAAGQTVNDPGSPAAVVTREAQPWRAGMDSLCAAMDDYRKITSPDFSIEPKLRAENRKVIDKWIDEYAQRFHGAKNAAEWVASTDSIAPQEAAMVDAIQSELRVAADATTTSNLFTQPSIAMALLVQAYQDLQALQFVGTIGPGLAGGVQDIGWTLNDGRIGSVVRVPVEYWTEPTGYGEFAGAHYDAGLLTPEGEGISEGNLNIMWLEFNAAWRRIATSLTRDVIRALGNGPLNYGAVARHLFHIAWAKSRRIDKALLDEISLASDEYSCVALGNSTKEDTQNDANLLATNSAYNAAGSVTVNLNPAKKASDAVASTDPYVTYGANVLGAIRLGSQVGKGNVPASPSSSSPGYATSWGPTPIVRPRVKRTLSASGQPSTTTVNPFTVGVVASATTPVEGHLNSTFNIADNPGGGTANYAVDYLNGVICLAAAVIGSSAQPVAGSGSVLVANSTKGWTFIYSYATNFDNFQITNITSLLAVGETEAEYYNRLFKRIDDTAAYMGSSPRFVKPNFALTTLIGSTPITNAQIYYKWASPDGTSLYPTESYFAQRNGINMARVNAPWWAGDGRIQLGRLAASKYAMDTPFEIRGPYPKYTGVSSTTLQITAAEVYYGEENSAIFTPQVTKQDGTVLNPAYRAILLR